MKHFDWALLDETIADSFVGPVNPALLVATIDDYTPDPDHWLIVQELAAVGVGHLDGLYKGADASTIAEHWRVVAALGVFYPGGLPCLGNKVKLPKPYNKLRRVILAGMCSPRFMLLKRNKIEGGFAYFPRRPLTSAIYIATEKRRKRIEYVESGSFANRRGSE